MKTARVPMRMCVGCGEMKPKGELIRIVKTPEGELLLDKNGRQNGRGAYLCRSAECLKRAQKSRRLQSAFSMQLPDEMIEKIEGEL